MSLNYSRIKNLQEQNKISNRKMAIILKMSDSGYGKMLDKKTCSVATLEDIAKYFKKPIIYFFDEELPVAQVSEPEVEIYACPECVKKTKTIRELENEIKTLKDELLEVYRSQTAGGKCG